MCRVLIVEDDDQLRATVEVLVLAADHEPLSTNDAASALELLEHAAVDVVLTDYRLGTSDGITLAAAIRSRWPTLPIALMSADLDESLARVARSVGVEECFPKPFAPGRLWSWLEGVERAAVVRSRHASR